MLEEASLVDKLVSDDRTTFHSSRFDLMVQL